MSLTLRKHLRVRKTLPVLDLSHLWVIPEYWNYRNNSLKVVIYTILHTGSQRQDIHHCNLCCARKISAVWGSPTFLVKVIPIIFISSMSVCIYTFFPYTSYVSHPQAYHRDLRYPRHLFLTYGWYVQNWWLVEDRNFSCTAEERESVLNRSLSFLQFDFLQDRNLTTDTGIVSPFLHASTPYCTHLYDPCKAVP